MTGHEEHIKKGRGKSRYRPIDIGSVDNHIVCLKEKDSYATEQFKHLRTHLLKFKQSNNTNLLMVASPSLAEGKSVVALNLAITITKTLHETVLLVDCDMRDPSLSKMLGIDKEEKGLSDYLTSDIELSQLLLRTDISKLTFLPSGSIPHNPSELLGSKKMVSLLEEIKERYSDRFIIIDTPPILLATDASVLGQYMDGVLIVVSLLKTIKDDFETSISLLKKANIIGLVLNRVNKKNIEDRYKRGYLRKGLYAK